MARATEVTLLPLDTFAKILGLHPLHFNQVEVANLAQAATCSQPLVQYSWQDADRVGREEIAYAIQEAESILHRELGYKILPSWEVDNRVQFPKSFAPELYNTYALNARGQKQSVKADWGYIISGGIEAKVVIEAGAAVVFSDVDGDGYSERATITVVTTVTDVNEIAIYYPGELGSAEWEIRPITVTISGGTATIRCRREQLVKPEFMEQLDVNSVDGLVGANFLATVDVYRHYNDPQQQVQFLWEAAPNYCTCGTDGCASCAMETQYGCLNVRDWRLGLLAFTPAAWNATESQFDAVSWQVSRTPDRGRLWYYAGWRNLKNARFNVDMDMKWARAVSYLALSLLDRPLCECDGISRVTRYWREDLAVNTPDSSVQLSSRHLDNPFGTTRAAIYAWDLVQKERLGIA